MSLVRFRGNRTGPWGYVYTERETSRKMVLLDKITCSLLRGNLLDAQVKVATLPKNQNL